MSVKEELTPGMLSDDDYEEVWVVILSTKGRYELTKNQGRLVREAMARGERGAVVFETFAIPIPFIAEFYREKRFLKGAKQLPARASEKPYQPIPKEKWEKIKKEIHSKLLYGGQRKS